MSILSKLRDAAIVALDTADAVTRRHVRFDDTAREAAISETVILWVARSWAGGEHELELAGRGDGYDLRARVRGGTLAGHVVPTAVRWRDGVIELELRTPESIRIDDRPIVSWFAAAIARLFGGTAVGRLLLNGATPDCVEWDGRTAVYRGELDLAAMPTIVRGAPRLDGKLVRSEGWLCLEIPDEGQYAEAKRHLKQSLVPTALELMRGAGARRAEG